MSLPGFNADATLYRSSNPYMMSSMTAASGGATDGITPQAFEVVGGDTSFTSNLLIGGGLIGGGGFGGGGLIGGGGGGIIGGGGGGTIGGGGGVIGICGNNGQQCCAGATCASGLVCLGGICRNPLTLCGASGQNCCPGGGCDAGLVCNQFNVCRRPCGDLNQACCTGGTCSTGLTCVNGTCVTPPPPCGMAGQPCCNGRQCGGALNCLNNTCMPCGFLGLNCCFDGAFGTCFQGTCNQSFFTCV